MTLSTAAEAWRRGSRAEDEAIRDTGPTSEIACSTQAFKKRLKEPLFKDSPVVTGDDECLLGINAFCIRVTANNKGQTEVLRADC